MDPYWSVSNYIGNWVVVRGRWGYRIVNVNKPPPTRLQASDFPVFPHPVLYAGNFKCPHANWSYRTSTTDGECLVAWASLNGLVSLHDPKDVVAFHSGRWNTGTNPDLTFVSVGPDSRVPDRRTLEKFSRLQHRPSLIVPPRLALPVPSKPVQRCGCVDQQICQEFVATRFTGCGSGLPGLLQCHQNSSQKFYPTRSSK